MTSVLSDRMPRRRRTSGGALNDPGTDVTTEKVVENVPTVSTAVVAVSAVAAAVCRTHTYWWFPMDPGAAVKVPVQPIE